MKVKFIIHEIEQYHVGIFHIWTRYSVRGSQKMIEIYLFNTQNTNRLLL